MTNSNPDLQFVINLEVPATGQNRYSFARFMGNKNPELNAESYSEYAPIYDPYDSYFMEQLQALPLKGIYTIATKAAENRPDNISYLIYGQTMYWHLILWYNNIMNYTDLIVGTQLGYPELKDLETLYFQLKSRQTAINRNNG